MGANDPTAGRWAPGTPVEIVLHGPGDRLVGRLRFSVCGPCRTGRILDIWVSEPWQHRGLGRELVLTLFARHPGHHWSTTSQTGAGRAFFTAMTEETAVSLPHGGPLCPHLRRRLRRLGRCLPALPSPRIRGLSGRPNGPAPR
ncbi:hypothetical protein GCM10010129_02010 [Streptomyces fumigatiscleroticus]|nr:hypothetical protein GCM10010129_02010 [Streptomyces fumigatiscleroticus]